MADEDESSPHLRWKTPQREIIMARKLACLAAAGFLGTLLVGAIAVPAHAQPGSGPVTVTAHSDQLTRVVAYGDLSLATHHGRHVLMRRVNIAIDQVCPKQDEYGIGLDAAGCQDFAWSGARPQIEQAMALSGSGTTTLSAAIEISGFAK